MRNGLRIIAHKGFVVPENIVQRAFKLYPSGFGLVAVTEGGEQSLEVEHFISEMPTIEQFMASQEEYKDRAKSFYFTHSDQPWPEASMQPFVIIRDAEEHAILAATVEGEISPLEEDVDKDETDEYNFVKNILNPMIEDLWQRHNGDMSKILASVQEKLFQNQIKNSFITRGVCDLYFASGETVTIRKGQEGMSGSWGNVSSPHFTLEEGEFPKKDEPVVEKKEKKSFLTKAIAAVTPFVPGGKEGKSIEEANKEKDRPTDSAILHTTRPQIAPPPDIVKKGKNALKTWYETNCVSVPEGYKDGPKADANDAFIAKHIGKNGAVPLAEGLAALKDSVMASKPGLPLIDGKTKGALTALIESKDVQAKVGPGIVIDVDKMKAETSKIGSFTEQLGIDFDILLRADHEIYCLIGKKGGIEALAAATVQLRNEVLDLRRDLDAVTTPEGIKNADKEKAKNPGDEAAEAEKQKAAPSTEEVKPAGGALFFQKKKAVA